MSGPPVYGSGRCDASVSIESVHSARPTVPLSEHKQLYNYLLGSVAVAGHCQCLHKLNQFEKGAPLESTRECMGSGQMETNQTSISKRIQSTGRVAFPLTITFPAERKS